MQLDELPENYFLDLRLKLAKAAELHTLNSVQALRLEILLGVIARPCLEISLAAKDSASVQVITDNLMVGISRLEHLSNWLLDPSRNKHLDHAAIAMAKDQLLQLCAKFSLLDN